MNKVEQQLGTPKSKSLATDTPPKLNFNTPKNGAGTPTTNTPRTGQKQSSNPLILLVGKLVFLDLNSSYKPLNKVKQCLNLIGAKIADCLSKDVDYVISNREATANADSSSKTSPNALNIGSRSSFINRTQSILEKASKGFTTSDILSTARRLGIKVMNIAEIERHIEKYLNKTRKNSEETTAKTKTELIRQSSFQLSKLSTNQKIYKLKNPFLKIESICKQYKPIYEEFDAWHEINLDIYTSKSTSSPFQIYFSDDIKADDENEEEQINSQMLQSTKNVFKSPASSKLPNDPTAKSNVLLNCANKLSSNNVKSKISMFNNNNTSHANTPGKPGSRLIASTNASKRKPTGYCECCKQRYENLKQHLTSVTHENFDKNVGNFKELDEYIDGVLNFQNFLIKNNLYNSSKEEAEPEAIKPDIDETKEFAKEFNKTRQSLGISQAQVVSALNTYQEPVFDESALNRFEQLDITPRSAARMKPVLERWLNDTTLKFGDRLKSLNGNNQATSINTPNPSDQTASGGCNKKRKRFSFSPTTLKELNSEFTRNSQPTPTHLRSLSTRLKQEEEEVSMWFAEKRVSLKKNKKKFKQSNVLDGLLNSSVDNESSFLNSSDKDQPAQAAALENKRPSKSLPGMWQQSTSVKAPCPNQKVALLRHTDAVALNQISSSLTPIRMNPAYEMSSPSAQVLFTLNSNSFTIPNETSFSASNTSPGQLKNKSMLASRLELINGTGQVQSIMDNESRLQVVNGGGYLSKSDNSTDLSLCVDDSIFNAFCNDFSYEIVHKKT